MPRKSACEPILDAAAEIVLEVGAAHMTLDAVAKRAGVSKGGLIYHFPTKEALLHAMVERLITQLQTARAEERTKLPDGPARELKAHVLSSINGSRRDERVKAAVVAAAAHDPKLLAPARVACRKAFESFATPGLRPERVAVIVAATEGLWLMQVLGTSPFSAKERRGIVAELQRLADT